MRPSDVASDLHTLCTKCRAALGDVEAIDDLKRHRLQEANECGMSLEEANLCLKDAFREYNMIDVTLPGGYVGHASLKDIPDIVEEIERHQKAGRMLPQPLVSRLREVGDVFAAIGSEFARFAAGDHQKQEQHLTLEEQAERACAEISAHIEALADYIGMAPQRGR